MQDLQGREVFGFGGVIYVYVYVGIERNKQLMDKILHDPI